MASFDKAAFEKKAFKFVPYLILGKIIFAAWFISYLVLLQNILIGRLLLKGKCIKDISFAV